MTPPSCRVRAPGGSCWCDGGLTWTAPGLGSSRMPEPWCFHSSAPCRVSRAAAYAAREPRAVQRPPLLRLLPLAPQGEGTLLHQEHSAALFVLRSTTRCWCERGRPAACSRGCVLSVLPVIGAAVWVRLPHIRLHPHTPPSPAAQIPEHTWGTDSKYHPGDYERWTNAGARGGEGQGL